MNQPARIPLFRLPIIAIGEVLSTLTPFEIINLSSISLSSSNLIKLFPSITTQYKLDIDIGTEPTVSVKGSNVYFEFKITSENEKNGRTFFEFHDDGEETHGVFKCAENVLDDWIELFKRVNKIWKFQYIAIVLNMDAFPEDNRKIVDLIKHQNRPVSALDFYGEQEADEDVLYAMSNLEVEDMVDFSVKLSDDFRPSLPEHLDKVNIEEGNWLTFEQLQKLNFPNIFIWSSNITAEQLNVLLLNWMSSESHQKLEFMKINLNDLGSFWTLLNNLPHVFVGREIVRAFDRNGELKWISGGVDIKRNDGASCTLYLDIYQEKLMLVLLVGHPLYVVVQEI